MKIIKPHPVIPESMTEDETKNFMANTLELNNHERFTQGTSTYNIS
jgi:hypothetical protein